MQNKEVGSLANAVTYCRLLAHIDDSAHKYSLWKASHATSRFQPPTGEKIVEIKERIKTALDDLFEANSGKKTFRI